MITQLRNGTWRIEGPGFDRTFDTQADAERMHEAFCPSKKPAVQDKLKPKHTPGPWRIGKYRDQELTGRRLLIHGPEAMFLADVYNGNGAYDVEANAARIVQCVNAHDVLVKALTAVMWHLDARLLASPDEHAQEAMDEGHAALEAAKVTP